MRRIFDIAVLGATPAGCAAAYCLAKGRCDVVLVETPGHASECPLTDWVPRELFSPGRLPRTLAGDCRAEPFATVCYHDSALQRQVQFSRRGGAGYFVRPWQLAKALTAAATKLGAKVCAMTVRPSIELGEDSVRIAGSEQVTARLLIIAQGSPHEALGELALPVRAMPPSGFVAAGLDIPAQAKALAGESAPAMHVVESRHRGQLAMFFASNGTLHLRVVSSSGAAAAPAAELTALVAGLKRANILSGDLPLDRARGAVWRPPAGEALDLETHVAKRCILAGTAGGFADNITGQTLAPSIRSAIIAADASLSALGSKDAQDALMHFKTNWRKALADVLRPPSTSLHMLLPLLFVNQRIVTRFTQALLYGESI